MGWPSDAQYASNYARAITDETGKVVGIDDRVGGKIGLANLFSVVTYGADSSGVVDATTAFQTAFTAAAAEGGGTVYVPKGLYKISSSLLVSNTVSYVQQNGATLSVGSGGTFIADAVFLINTLDGLNWIDDYPGFVAPEFHGLNIVNNLHASITAKAIITGSSLRLSNFNTWNMHGLVKTTSNYLDSIAVDRGLIHAAKGSDYQIELSFLGDSFYVNQVHTADNATAANLLKVSYCNGGKISCGINGNYLIKYSNGVAIDALHNELGQIVSDASSLTVRNSVLWELGVPAIKTIDTSSGGRRGSLVVDDVDFVFMRGGGGIAPSTHQIEVTSDVNLQVRNCRKMYTISGELTTIEHMGIDVGDSGGRLALWHNLASQLSINGHVSKGKKTPVISHAVTTGSGTYYSIASVAKSGTTGPTWATTAGTYYYRGQRIYDIGRMIGVGDSEPEQSITMALTDYTVRLTTPLGSFENGGFYRLYRGTATGSYSHFVDIPLSSTGRLFDDGVAVNGIAWESRTPAGRDAIHYCGDHGITWQGKTVTLFGTAIPTVGVWSLGDRIINVATGAGVPDGWVCTVAGTPGTWRALANRV